MDSIAERLISIRQSQGVSQTALAKKLGIAQSTLSQLESGASVPGAELLSKLQVRYNIDINWLLNGEGTMYIDDQDRRDIVLVDVEAKAGYIDHKGSRDFLSSLGRYRVPGFDDVEDGRIFEVEGDSMLPTLYPGDYIVCREKERPELVPENTLCVVISDDILVVKRVSYFEAEKGYLILRSDNSTYKPQMIPREDIQELWRVSGRITTAVDYAVMFNTKRLISLEKELGLVRQKLEQLVNRVTLSDSE